MKVREWEATERGKNELLTVFQWALFDDGKLAYKQVETQDAEGETLAFLGDEFHVVCTVKDAQPSIAEHVIVHDHRQVLQRVL